jgi:hypothetical protein
MTFVPGRSTFVLRGGSAFCILFAQAMHPGVLEKDIILARWISFPVVVYREYNGRGPLLFSVVLFGSKTAPPQLDYQNIFLTFLYFIFLLSV